MQRIQKGLQAELNAILPDAKLDFLTLPEASNLELLLIDEHYPIEQLAPEQAQAVMDNPLYWLFCWASGLALAQMICANELDVRGKTVLDVGAGSGVVAIAAAKAGAARVIASDIDVMSQQVMAVNAAKNNVQLEIVGDFNECTDVVDLIFLADVLYDKNNYPLLDAVVSKGRELYVADSRIKDFNHPSFSRFGKRPSLTLPELGGFDEFNSVNIYYRDCEKNA